MADRKMTHVAPWPSELEDLVGRARCWDGWSFRLQDGEWDDGAASGVRLIITVISVNAYAQEKRRGTSFLFPVPSATFDRASWQRWLWDRVLDVHRHETGEAFRFAYRRPNWEGEVVEVEERPFAPFHGPGRDPNRNVEVGVDPMESRVRQDGGRYAGWWWDGNIVHNDADHDQCIAHGLGRSCTPVHLVPEVSE